MADEHRREIHNHEERLKYYELLLEKEVTGPFPEVPLPEGYRYVNYRDGDCKDWIAIEYSAREFISEEEGRKSWARFYGGKEAELYDRMFFIETDTGEKAATATAFYEPRDPEGCGWLHWIAVKQEHQGKGLARPLISHVLNRLVELHYAKIKIPTQTTSWVAVRLYLSFGFRPVPKNAVTSREGYRMMRTLTGHPSLHEFPALPEEELWDKEMCAADRYMKARFGDTVRFRVNKEKGKIIYQAGDTYGELENIEKYLTGEKKDS